MTGLSYKYSIVRHFFFFCLSIKLIKSVERQGIENQTLEKLEFLRVQLERTSSAQENMGAQSSEKEHVETKCVQIGFNLLVKSEDCQSIEKKIWEQQEFFQDELERAS